MNFRLAKIFASGTDHKEIVIGRVTPLEVLPEETLYAKIKI